MPRRHQNPTVTPDAPVAPRERFHVFRDRRLISNHIQPDAPLVEWFCSRLMAYPTTTNRYLFQRHEHTASFVEVAHYVVGEIYAAVSGGVRTIVCPRPDGKFKTMRYTGLDARILVSVVAALEKHHDLNLAPWNAGGDWDFGTQRWLANEYVVAAEVLNVFERAVTTDAINRPRIVMRTSWPRLKAREKEAFQHRWLYREACRGRTGFTMEPIWRIESDPTSGKPSRRKVGERHKFDRDRQFHYPRTASEWTEIWKSADSWYAEADGRIMAVDEPGVAAMVGELSRSNRFTTLHEWRDGRGCLESASARMSYRVFRDDRLDEHGRYYYPAQSKAKAVLDGFTVNGEETDTCDIVCTHPTMILGEAGRSILEAPYNGDVYGAYAREELAAPEKLQMSLVAELAHLDKLDDGWCDRLVAPAVIRQQWKRAFSVCLNARDRQSAINALARIDSDDPSEGHLCPWNALPLEHDILAKPFWSRERIAQVVDVLMVDPFFGPHMCKSAGSRLMRQDARWMERVRRRLEDAGIPYRDVHDSITGPISRRAEIEAIMKQEWRVLFGFEPAVKWNKRA